MPSIVPVAGGRITAALLASIAPLAVVKGADESVTSSTTLQDDNELFAAVPANSTWLFVCMLDYEANTGATAGIQWQWSVGTATMRYALIANTVAATSVPVVAEKLGSSNPSAGGNGAGNLMPVLMAGSVVVGGTAETIQLQWAQAATSVTATIVHAQSLLALWRVS